MRNQQLETILPQMLAAQRGNQWSTYRNLNVYVRVSLWARDANGQRHITIQVANINRNNTKSDPISVMHLIAYLRSFNKPILFEQVLNKALLAALLRGFKPYRVINDEIVDVIDWNLPKETSK